MAGINCPKCGHGNAADAVICGGCDYILDTSFLGDDILNQPTRDDADLPPPTGEASEYGGDAVILGKLQQSPAADGSDWDNFMSDRTGSFLAAETHDGVREIEPAPVYLDRTTQQMLEPNAVLRVKASLSLSAISLSPFEQHVLSFVDGDRPVARIRKKAALSMSDTKIALAMLADRGVLELVGLVKPGTKLIAQQLAGELDDESGEERTIEQSVEQIASAQLIHTEAPPPSVPSSSDGFGEATLPLPEAPALAPTAVLPPRVMRAPPAEVVAAAPSALSPTGSRPAAPAPGVPPAVPVGGGGSRPIDPAREQGLKLYELALADLRAGKKARAHMYAKMAQQTAPDEPKITELLANWANAEKLAKSESEDQRLVAEAQRAEDAGDFGRALHLLKQAVEKNPLAAELHNRVGVILATRMCDYTAASSALLRSVELDPKNMVYRSNLGKVFKMSEGKNVGALIADGNLVPGAASGPTTTRPASMLDRLKGKVGPKS